MAPTSKLVLGFPCPMHPLTSGFLHHAINYQHRKPEHVLTGWIVEYKWVRNDTRGCRPRTTVTARKGW